MVITPSPGGITKIAEVKEEIGIPKQNIHSQALNMKKKGETTGKRPERREGPGEVAQTKHRAAGPVSMKIYASSRKRSTRSKTRGECANLANKESSYFSCFTFERFFGPILHLCFCPIALSQGGKATLADYKKLMFFRLKILRIRKNTILNK